MKDEVGMVAPRSSNRDGRRSQKVVWQEMSTIPGWNKVMNGQCAASSQTHNLTSKSLIAISRITITELIVACLDSI